MDNDHSDQFLTVTGWALKDRHLVLKLQKLIWRWAPAKTLGKMSSQLISSWKGSKRRSQHRQLSLSLLVILCCISGSTKCRQIHLGNTEFCRRYKSAVKEFVIPWFFRLANLSETDFPKLFCQQICTAAIFSFTNENWRDAVIHLFLLQYLIS